MKITVEQLTQIIGKPNTAKRFIEPLNVCLEKYEINTPARIVHFLAQILHESGCFLYNKEIASGKAYEGRKDLGNINVGDGVLFKGRSFIQITGRSNYKLISEALGVDFVANPVLLESDQYAFLGAGWFWNTKKLNKYADVDDFLTITKRINGGTNGLEDRKNWLMKCKAVIK